jgi:hypothetical protein
MHRPKVLDEASFVFAVPIVQRLSGALEDVYNDMKQ